MCAALIGNINWNSLESVNYARGKGVSIHTIAGGDTCVTDSVCNADLIVMLTDKTTHEDRRKVVESGRRTGTPVLMRHSCALNSILRLLKSFSK